jgi:hypothetical protein
VELNVNVAGLSTYAAGVDCGSEMEVEAEAPAGRLQINSGRLIPPPKAINRSRRSRLKSKTASFGGTSALRGVFIMHPRCATWWLFYEMYTPFLAINLSGTVVRGEISFARRRSTVQFEPPTENKTVRRRRAAAADRPQGDPKGERAARIIRPV